VYSVTGKPAAIPSVPNVGNIGRGLNNVGFVGQIAEVLVYNRALTDSELAQVAAYLKSKYGL
jgi:hypothetical protein